MKESICLLLIIISTSIWVHAAPTKFCDDGFAYHRETDACYTVPPQTFLAWTDAQEYCSTKLGGQLATVKDSHTFNFLAEHIKSVNGENGPFWIGLRFTSNATKADEEVNPYAATTTPAPAKMFLQWVDKEKPFFTKFAAGEPSAEKQCIAWPKLEAEMGWSTKGCSEQAGFICQKPLRKFCPPPLYTASVGTLASHNWPDAYFARGVDCNYYIEAPEGFTIRLQFEFFRSGLYNSGNCNGAADILYINDDDGSMYDEIHSRCGDWDNAALHNVYQSTGNHMTLRFVTHREQPYYYASTSKWKANYQFVKDDRTLRYNSTSGNLTSLHFPKFYPKKTHQLYSISVPAGKRVQITVEFFATTAGDFLRIVDGSYSMNGTQLALLSGPDGNHFQHRGPLPFVITSNSNHVMMKFKTYADGGAAKGWGLRWVAVD